MYSGGKKYAVIDNFSGYDILVRNWSGMCVARQQEKPHARISNVFGKK
jgi:hypothetical protein